MAQLPQDRLVRKEVALGVIREIPPPTDHIGTALIAPFKDVESDDVIFSYVMPEVDGLAPARAEDSEAELAQKDDSVGTGRASIIDWALKDHYDPSDVSRYREYLRLAELAAGGGSFPLTIGRIQEDFPARLARHDRTRRRKLDNRIEWLIMSALETGVITYNDGKIKFSVDFQRPAGQTKQAPSGGLWSLTASDPLGDFFDVDEFMYTTYGFHFSDAGGGLAVGSRKAWMSLLNSDRWAARSGLAGATGGVPIDPRYLIDGWGLSAVMEVFARQTGIKPVVYDAVYRTRAIGSTNTVNNRFLSDKDILFLPPQAVIDELSDTEIGFAKTLTSPHPEGNWTSGYYEWEKDTGPDPWGLDRGTGLKAFPVLPHLEYTYSLTVLP